MNTSDPEVIDLSDSDDDEDLHNLGKDKNFDDAALLNQRNIISPVADSEEQELPDIDSENSDDDLFTCKFLPSGKPYPTTFVSSKISKKKRSHKVTNANSSSDSSDVESKPIKIKKKKRSISNLNTSKGIHETSTDEIDSDDNQYSPSKNMKMASSENQQPCGSRSLSLASAAVPIKSRTFDTYAVELRKPTESAEEDFDLPDIDEVVHNVPTSVPIQTKVGANKKGADRESKLKKKEAETESRKADREQKRIAKEVKAAEQQREKALKKSENDIRKTSKPGEAIKFVIIEVDQEVSEKYSSLIPILVASDVRYQIKYGSVIANSFTFQRETIQQAMGDDLELHKVSSFTEENQLMILVDANEAIPMISAYLQKELGRACEIDEIDIVTWVDSIKSEHSSKKITLFFIGMDDYFKKIKKSTQQEFRDRVLNGGNLDKNPKSKRTRKGQKQLPDVSKLEVQSSLIDMQIRTEVNYRMVKHVKELGFLLIQYTKAIAEAPFKRQKMTDNGFDWYALADSTGSARVDKDGNGLRSLWILQLQCFNNVGVDTAKAIAELYPSPQALTNAFLRCSTLDEGHALLRDIKVKLGIGPLAKYRKIGPELSKRMYRFFTSTDGEKFLSSTADTL